MSMITATSWVPRGFAAPFPKKYDIQEDEYDRIAELARLQLEDAKEDLEEAEEAEKQNGKSKGKEKGEPSNGASGLKSQEEIDDDLKEYDLEHYDDDDDGEDGEGGNNGIFTNIKSLVYHQNGEEDPYITLKEGEVSDDEREELQILGTDNLVLAAKLEDEIAHLEVYVYEDGEDNLYVHHDIMLPAIPLALEWLDMPVGRNIEDKGGKGNFVAVGTMDPDIELWDLDVVDCMYPNAVLGAAADDADKPKKKKKKKSKKANDDYHVDAVLSLAANRQHRNLLASSSADKTVKLWDLNTAKCAKSYSYHTDKVCSLAWHPQESTVLLSGSYDRTVAAADMRAPEAKMPRWGAESDIEIVKWDPHDPHYFYAATENGVVHFHDARNAPSNPASTKPVWMLQAHDQAVNAFDVNPIIPGFLATGSTDKEVKLWNVQESGPSMVVSRNLEVGKVFSTNFAPDQEVGFRLAVAGSKGTVQIWDTSTNAAVRSAFANKVAPSSGDVKERLVGVADASSDSESGEEEEADEDAPDGWESMSE